MARFIIPDHRNRRKLTLTAQHSDSIDVSVTLTLDGKRVLELSDGVCARYADALDAYVAAGTLLRVEE